MTELELEFLPLDQIKSTQQNRVRAIYNLLLAANNDQSYPNISKTDRANLIEILSIEYDFFQLNHQTRNAKLDENQRMAIIRAQTPIPTKPIFIPFLNHSYACLVDDKLVLYSEDMLAVLSLEINTRLAVLAPLETQSKFWLIGSFKHFNNLDEFLDQQPDKTQQMKHLAPDQAKINTRQVNMKKAGWGYTVEVNKRKFRYEWNQYQNDLYYVSYADRGRTYFAWARVLPGTYLRIIETNVIQVRQKYEWWLEQFDNDTLLLTYQYFVKQCDQEMNRYLDKINFKPDRFRDILDPIQFIRDQEDNNEEISEDMTNLLQQMLDNETEYKTPMKLPELEGYYGIRIK